MRDLLVIVPSRGRPDRLGTMLDGSFRHSTARTDVVVALDDDDAARYDDLRTRLDGNRRLMWHAGPRDTLTGWTNGLAAEYAGRYRALASFGDDHWPRTPGWDSLLLGTLDAMGGSGFAYPDDRRRLDVPEAVVVSSDIVRALGWLCEPSLRHFYVDNVWADLGHGAGCLSLCQAAVVEHMHWERGLGEHDQTYQHAEAGIPADREAYERWQQDRMAGDIRTVRSVLAARCP